MASAIIVSNRLPVSIKKTKTGFEVFPSAGGLATGLATYASRRGNLWIGWPGLTSDDLTEKDKYAIYKRLANYNCYPVFLTKKQIDGYYNGYSNSVLWPLLHSMKADLTDEQRSWRMYNQVNEQFRDAVLEQSNPGSTVWVHDYHLMLLPKMLRAERPTDDIGIFLHVPFPPARQFAKLKQAPAILNGLLGSDLIGLHTKNYVKHFLDGCNLLTDTVPAINGVALKNRVVRVADFPIGIDYVKYSTASRTISVQKELLLLKRKYHRQKVILTVDRLDPTKGFIERLKAFDTFLKDSPELHGRVKMVMLAVPSRSDVAAYKKLKKNVEQLVSRINKKYRNLTWQPIDYMYKSVSFEKLSALYQLADIAFVAPIRDGMNLVAKEYVASKGIKGGILILSETAGAAQELKSALLVNPSRQTTLVKALKKAFQMTPRELKQRSDIMRRILSKNTIYNWTEEFLGALNRPINTKRTPNLTKLRQKNLISNFQSATNSLLLLDYDGVLAPFKLNPEDSKPTAAVRKVLRNLAKSAGTQVVVISGRKQQDLEAWLGDLPITLVAEHGALIRTKKSWRRLINSDTTWMNEFLPIMQFYSDDVPGAFVESKSFSLVWHYRASSAFLANKNIAIMRRVLKTKLKKYKLKMSTGNKIIEVRDPAISKGNATKHLLVDKPFDFILAIGDDFTDEEMFHALPPNAYSIKVGPGKTIARYRLDSPASVAELLGSM